jgi:hypothetical protein
MAKCTKYVPKPRPAPKHTYKLLLTQEEAQFLRNLFGNSNSSAHGFGGLYDALCAAGLNNDHRRNWAIRGPSGNISYDS